MLCAARAHNTHDWRAPSQSTSPDFEIGLPHIRGVGVGDDLLDKRLRFVADARLLPDWAVHALERGAAATEQAGGGTRGEVVSVTIEEGVARIEGWALADAARKPQARAAAEEDADVHIIDLRVFTHRWCAKQKSCFVGIELFFDIQNIVLGIDNYFLVSENVFWESKNIFWSRNCF